MKMKSGKPVPDSGKGKKQVPMPVEKPKLMPFEELTERDRGMGFVIGGGRSLEENMMDKGEIASLMPFPLPDAEPPWDHIDKVRTQLKEAFPDLTDAELEASGL